MNKLAMILGISTLALSTVTIAAEKANDAEASKTMKSSSVFGDPEKGGIGYEWTVTLEGKHGHAGITGSVGGKSSYEPQFDAPEIGWTHTSDWVALEMKEKGVLTITVERQAGVYFTKIDKKTQEKSFVTAGSKLYPALSIYTGWDSTTAKEKGSFNPQGNFWSTIKFKDVVYSNLGQKSITYKAKLPAGKYSVNIGGVNALYCKESDSCFNGLHGYRASFSTSHPFHLIKSAAGADAGKKMDHKKDDATKKPATTDAGKKAADDAGKKDTDKKSATDAEKKDDDKVDHSKHKPTA
ncbi:MAG: hypothetical protein KAG26_01385 [Methylococcales bacterium]|nr:hypothetical protein [Methylococcales bacterium]